MIVFDTSVAAKWIVDEPDSEKARSLLLVDREMVAPDLILPELSNVLLKKERMGHVSASQVDEGLVGVRNAIERYVSCESLMSEVLKLARRLSHATYDCVFLACAKPSGILLTADSKFVEKLVDPDDRRNVMALDMASVELVDAAIAALTVDASISRSFSILSKAPDEISRSVYEQVMRLPEDERPMAYLGQMLWEEQKGFFAEKRIVKLLANKHLTEQRDIVALMYLGQAGREISDWNEAKQEAQVLVDHGIDDGLVWLSSHAANLPAGIRKVFDAYVS